MILYRPVSLQELELIYDNGMKAFPARLPQQPIFYPVLQLEYARQIASDWNAKSGGSAGYVTQFKVEDPYIDHFETHTVGSSQHQEYWIPAEELEEFNKHISGRIKVVEAYFGNAFQGFVPETFGLQGKNAIEQFTLLSNSYVYKRMDFYLEIKRNHKAVFLNYPFWQKYDSKNPGLKAKVIQAIKEAWLTSFPQNPLATTAPETVTPVKETDAPAKSFEKPMEKDAPSIKPASAKSFVSPLHKDIRLAKRTDAQSAARAAKEDRTPVEETETESFEDSFEEDITSEEQEDIFDEGAEPIKKTNIPAKSFEPPVHENTVRERQTNYHAEQLVNSFDQDSTREEETDSDSFEDSLDEEGTAVGEIDAPAEPFAKPLDEEITADEEIDSPSLENRIQENTTSVQPIDSRPQRLVHPLEEIKPRKQTPSHFAQGLEFGLRGKYREAITEFSKAIEEDPDDVVAYTSLGVAFHRLGEDDRALSCYEAALKKDSKSAETHYFRANILYSQGYVREAIDSYTMAVGLKPELIEAHQKSSPQDRLADYSPSPSEIYRIAKPAHRILELNELLESNPQRADLIKERAAAYYRLWNYEEAIADYSSALALQPNDADALHLRGLAYEQIDQFEHARHDYQQAIAINPQLSNAYMNRAVTFGQMGSPRQAMDSLNEAIRLAHQNPDGYFNRAILYFQLGDFARAIEDFSNVIQLSPSDEAAYYWRGISHEEAGHQREAIADYKKFLASSRDEIARAEIEQRLIQWKEDQSPTDSQKTNQVPAKKSDQILDLYDLIVALGERAVNSTWVVSGVECYGEKADELYAFTDHNRPIQGRDLLSITSGIYQTIQGDFEAFDPDSTSPWLFIRAWNGNGFYIETNDPKIKEELKRDFRSMEEVEGARPPYESLFIGV